ncbi:MAG TPA: PKD domain-containing protein [Methanoregula sp.]|nr:PKD domain-containing protein [Methanoregula sp.]
MLSSLLLCGPAVAESRIFYCPYGQTDPFCMPWGTITAFIHETEGGDLGNRIDHGQYECEYEMLNYYTFRLKSCENLVNYEATATIPFTIPDGVNLSRTYRAHVSFDGPGDSGGGSNIPSCANVRGYDCEEPVYYLNGIEMTDWIDEYGAKSSFGWVDPAILTHGVNTLEVRSKPLWTYINMDGFSGGPFYTGRIDIDDVYVILQTSYLASEMPELLDLVVAPEPVITGHDAEVMPVVSPGGPEWEIIGISYQVIDRDSGRAELYRVIPGTANLTFRPAPGTYGRKWLIAKMHVQEKLTGHREISEVKTPLRIYFDKGQYPNWADDDGDGVPNWFTYWKKDGAVPGLNDSVNYLPNLPGYGVASLNGTAVWVSPLAASVHYSMPLVIPSTVLEPSGESFGGPEVTGIDCLAEVIAHENYHNWVNRQWLDGGSFVGMTDSDYNAAGSNTFNDKLPDTYEQTVSMTFTTDTDSYFLFALKHPTYLYYGDNEYMAMRTGNTGRGIPAKDWAYPGKQAGHIVDLPLLNPPPGAGACGGMCDIVSDKLPDAVFQGVEDTPQDTNANGRYDLLTAANDIPVSLEGVHDVVAVLSGDPGTGTTVIDIRRNLQTFEAGNYSVAATFDGTAISSAGIDGPYTVNLSWQHEFQENGDPPFISWETAAYTSAEFELPPAVFSGTATGSAASRNLSVTVPLQINTAGVYTVEGYLQDPAGTPIAHAATTGAFITGTTNAGLVFDGNAIAAGHQDGTYSLVNFRILDVAGTTISRQAAAGTVAIVSSEFGSTIPILTGSYSEEGRWEDDLGRFEELSFEAGIDATVAGRYFYSAMLFDEEGDRIETVSGSRVVNTPGPVTLTIPFKGQLINANGVDGTFSIRSLEIIGPAGSDLHHQPLTTRTYTHTQFAAPAFQIIGNITDYPVDLNSDGIYDAVRVGFDIRTGSQKETFSVPLSGDLTVTGANQSGPSATVIAHAEGGNFIPKETTAHVTLDFPGTDINGMATDGPYTLRNLKAGASYSGLKPAYYTGEYATAAYDHTQFGPTALLIGTVIDDVGRPLGGVSVSAGAKTTNTNDAGFYRFYYATGGTMGMLVNYPPALNLSYGSRTVSVSSGNTTYANFTLFRPVEIHGTVTAENGTIISEGSIIAEGPGTSVFQLDSWGNGSYRITGLRNGTYTIRYTRVGSSDVIAAPLKDTYLTPGQSYEWDVVAYQRRSISGTVTDIYGDPLKESEVSITEGPFTRTWPSNVETDAVGAYSFLNLVPGTYTIEAEPPWPLRNDLIINTTSVTIDISDNTITKDIVLMPEPVAPVAGDWITCDVYSGPPPLTVSFGDRSSGYPTSWLWNFGDGTGTSTERNPVHTYTDYGIYNITLTVSNDYGTDTGYFDDDGGGWIHVKDLPTPRVILPEGTLGAGGSGTFPLAVTDILNSDMADDIILKLRFDPSVLQLDNVTWHAPFSGQPITTNIDNVAGEADIHLAFWSWPDLSETTDLADLHFTAVGSPGAQSLLTADPAVWRNCPDGCISSPLAVTNGSITVAGGGGGALPVPDFTATPTSGDAPLTVTFDASGSDVLSPTAYLWMFGDGNTSALANPTFTYSIPGTYDVALQITNATGTNTTTMTGYITAHPTALPTPSITSVTPLTGYRNSTIEFLIQGNHFLPENTTIGFITQANSLLAVNISTVTLSTINGTLEIPAGTAPGPCRVRVSTTGGEDIRANAFSVIALPPPAITAISPAGTWFRNTSVDFSITGTGFQQGKTTVTFASPTDGSALNATSGVTITDLAPTRINGTIMVPHNAPATAWNVSVTTIDGGTFWKPQAFSVSSVPKPSITALAPLSGIKNSTIPFRISGTGFQKDKTLVRIGEDVMDTELDISLSDITPTLITGTIRIADDAIAGRYFLDVRTVDGGSAPTKANTFSVMTLSFPSITSIKPAEGLANSTVAFVITGKNFQPGNTVVELRNQTTGIRINHTTLTSVSDTTITGTISIPSQTPPSKYRLDITTMNGGVAGKANAFVVSTAKPPAISSITPAFGPKHCTVAFTVTGTNFQDGEKTSVRLIDETSGADLAATIFSATPTKIIGNVNIPASAASGLYRVEVTTIDGGTATKPQAFLINHLSLPIINSISPTSGPKGATTQFTLKGNNFQDGGTTVRLRGQGKTLTANLTQVDMTTAEGSFTISPATPTGIYRLDVFTTGGGFNSRMNAFTVTAAKDGAAAAAPDLSEATAPSITSLSPMSPWSRNSTIEFTISGSGFEPDTTGVSFTHPGKGTILNSSANISLSMVSPAQITGTVIVPSDAPAGSWDIRVSTSKGGFALMPDAFDVPDAGETPLLPNGGSPAVSITSFTPTTVYRNDTLSFTLTGTGFGQEDMPRISLIREGRPDELVATVSSDSPTIVTGTIDIPPTAEAGAWDVFIVTSEGITVRRPGEVTIMAWPAPALTAFSPSVLKLNETQAQSCTIEGTGYQETGRTSVMITGPGGEEIPLTIIEIDQTMITGTIKLPMGMVAGPGSLSVTTADGGTVTSAGSLTIQ